MMQDYIVVLDACFYHRRENGVIQLRGWMFTGKDEPEVQVRADHESVPFEFTRFSRPDVCSIRKDLPFPDDRVGFDITITDLERWMREAENLRVRVVCGEKKIPVLQKSMEELFEEYKKESYITYNIDFVRRRGKNVFIQAWAVYTGDVLEKKLVDSEGNELQDVIWQTSSREDVMAVYKVSRDECVGFSAEFPRKSITGAKIYLQLSTEESEKQVEFDLKELDRKSTRPYRLKELLSKPYQQRNRELIQDKGWATFFDYLWEESYGAGDSYEEYFLRHKVTSRELRKQRKEVFPDAPLFSIVVPLYKTPVNYLKELIDSICQQSYEGWELCLADGSGDNTLGKYIQKEYPGESRIRYKLLKDNTGISGNTNEALEMARGDYIVFADHDDTLERDALYHAACVLRDHPETEMIYTDEDLMNENGISFNPHIKPDFNLEYLRCINYICHLVIVKHELYKRVGGLRSEYDGAQDYDFVLRCVEKTNHIYHIPRVLYHWRSHQGSTAGNVDSKTYAIDAAKRALEAHYERTGENAEVKFTGHFIVFSSKFQVEGNPKISILIPNKDHTEDLDHCIQSIEQKSTWKNYEIVVIENNSELDETFAYYEQIQQEYDNVRIVKYEGIFNYSAINNVGAAQASGDYYLLLNNDTEVITPDWMEIMLGYCQKEDVAITGAKLYYPDDTIQHAGIVVGLGGFAGHVHSGLPKNNVGFMGRLVTSQEISAVTGACMLVKKSVYDELQGLDEDFAVALNDVDFCLRARELGKKVVYANDAELYHFESKSRGYEDTPEKLSRFWAEIEHFQKRHTAILDAGDPYYNPTLTLEKGDCSMRKKHEFLRGR